MPEDVTLYWWPKCSQCRRVRDVLDRQGVQFEARDFFARPFTAEEVTALAGARPLREVFSWRSPAARALGFNPEDPPPDSVLIEAMLREPRLVRRPIVRVGQHLVIGSGKAEMEALEEALRAGA